MIFTNATRVIAMLISLNILGCHSVDLKKETPDEVGPQEKSVETVSLEGFQIIGIKTRTTNAAEMKGAGKITALWTQFYTQQVLKKIPGKVDQDIVAVYHAYEGDANAPYSLLVGARVKVGTKVPKGLEILTIPTQTYFKLTSEKGEMPKVVIDAWKNIWTMTAKSELNRKYSYDLEVYGKNATNPKSLEVDLFIAVERYPY